MTIYSRYKLSFAAYLSMPALISGLHKMPQTLVLSFLALDLDIRGGAHIHCEKSIFSME